MNNEATKRHGGSIAVNTQLIYSCMHLNNTVIRVWCTPKALFRHTAFRLETSPRCQHLSLFLTSAIITHTFVAFIKLIYPAAYVDGNSFSIGSYCLQNCTIIIIYWSFYACRTGTLQITCRVNIPEMALFRLFIKFLKSCSVRIEFRCYQLDDKLGVIHCNRRKLLQWLISRKSGLVHLERDWQMKWWSAEQLVWFKWSVNSGCTVILYFNCITLSAKSANRGRC